VYSKREIKKFVAAEKKYIWYPFTQMADWQKEEPLIIESGNGVYLTDVYGRRYIDGVSSLWVNIHGHRNKIIDKAINVQMKKIAHTTFLGLTHIPAIELAGRLIKIVPKNLSKVFYSDNGSTAVEVALKMAYQYRLQKGEKKRNKFLSLKNAYHGDTIGSVSVGGMDLFHEKFKPLLFDCHFAPSPYCYRCLKKVKSEKLKVKNKRWNDLFKHHCKNMGCSGYCISAVEDILLKHRGEIAAAVV